MEGTPKQEDNPRLFNFALNQQLDGWNLDAVLCETVQWTGFWLGKTSKHKASGMTYIKPQPKSCSQFVNISYKSGLCQKTSQLK